MSAYEKAGICIIVAGVLMGLSAARANEKENDRGGNAFERAVEKLEKFESKIFRHEDFEGKTSLPASLAINPNGEVRITNAHVLSVASTTMSVKVWGLSFTVNADTNTRVLFGKEKVEEGTLSSVHVDDSVQIVGATTEGAPGTVLARVVHDNTAVTRVHDEEVSRLRQRIEELIRRLQDLLSRSHASSTATSSGSH